MVMATDNLVIGAWPLWNPGIPAATSQPASTEPAPRPKPSLTTLRIGKLKICHVGGAQHHVKPRRRGHQGPQPFCLPSWPISINQQLQPPGSACPSVDTRAELTARNTPRSTLFFKHLDTPRTRHVRFPILHRPACAPLHPIHTTLRRARILLVGPGRRPRGRAALHRRRRVLLGHGASVPAPLCGQGPARRQSRLHRRRPERPDVPCCVRW